MQNTIDIKQKLEQTNFQHVTFSIRKHKACRRYQQKCNRKRKWSAREREESIELRAEDPKSISRSQTHALLGQNTG